MQGLVYLLAMNCGLFAVAGAPGAPSPNLSAAGGAGGTGAKGSEDYTGWSQYYSPQIQGNAPPPPQQEDAHQQRF